MAAHEQRASVAEHPRPGEHDEVGGRPGRFFDDHRRRVADPHDRAVAAAFGAGREAHGELLVPRRPLVLLLIDHAGGPAGCRVRRACRRCRRAGRRSHGRGRRRPRRSHASPLSSTGCPRAARRCGAATRSGACRGAERAGSAARGRAGRRPQGRRPARPRAASQRRPRRRRGRSQEVSTGSPISSCDRRVRREARRQLESGASAPALTCSTRTGQPLTCERARAEASSSSPSGPASSVTSRFMSPPPRRLGRPCGSDGRRGQPAPAPSRPRRSPARRRPSGRSPRRAATWNREPRNRTE